jgi:adenosylcobinamide-GDP ribazoletransferase
VLGELLPSTLAVAVSMAATVALTGAFHEDGFADVCDGFGGGWDKAQILRIMKDSRIGAYGTIGAVLMLGTKLLALIELGTAAAVAMIVAHPLSRLASTTLIYALDYARDDADARAKPLAHRLSRGELTLAALSGAAPLALLPPPEALAGLALVMLVTLVSARYFVRRIGGYTGDCLGAAQQLAELASYFGMLLAWNFI